MFHRDVYIPTAEVRYLLDEIRRAGLQFVAPIHIDGDTYTVHLEDRINLRDYGAFTGDLCAMLRVVEEFRPTRRRER